MPTKIDFIGGNTKRCLMAMAIPMIAAMFLNMMYNLVDSLWIGNLLGETAYAALTNSTPIILILTSVAMGATNGVSILISQAVGAKDKKKLLYIAPVEFYNNTTSESHTQSIRELFADNPDFYITDKEDLADYVVRSKVLRAKVDPINSNTNRLQMVLAMGVKIKDSGTTSVEHQNRFILFSSEEDEQKVAADLMKKLFKKASEPILNKIENDIRKKSDNGSLITPNK